MHKKRYKNAIKLGIVGIIINLFLTTIKIILSYFTNSVSILSDAINNLSDMTSSVLTILGFKLSNKKPSKTHPYGYARYEYISSFLISIFMFITSIIFIIESISKIIYPEKLVINKITYLILLITLIIKISQFIFYKTMKKKINSLSIDAIIIETRNDIITNISILISMLVIQKLNINIDGYISLVISIILIKSSIEMLKNSIDFLIGKAHNQEEIKNIKNKILIHKEIKNINKILIHNYGENINYIDIHISLNKKEKINNIKKLISKIENSFEENITIQIDF
jgi:cation diffusion facilitator family transporter